MKPTKPKEAAWRNYLQKRQTITTVWRMCYRFKHFRTRCIVIIFRCEITGTSHAIEATWATVILNFYLPMHLPSSARTGRTHSFSRKSWAETPSSNLYLSENGTPRWMTNKVWQMHKRKDWAAKIITRSRATMCKHWCINMRLTKFW